MPYLDEDLLKDEDKDSGEQLSPGSQVIGSGASAQQATNTAKKGGGQFANLDEYLRVNGPQNFGQQLAGKVGQDVSDASGVVDQAGQEFKNRVDQSTVKDPNGVVQNALNDPSNFVADQNNVKDWNNLFNAQYKGPSQLQDSSDLYNTSESATQTAEGKAKAANSEEGRFALLDNYFAKPNYSSGQKSLDNLLVQNDENANQAFNQVQQNADALVKRQQDQAKALGDYGSQGKATTDATRANARAAIGVDDTGNPIAGAGAIGTLQGTLDSQLADFVAKQNQDYTNFSSQVAEPGYGALPSAVKGGPNSLVGPEYGYDYNYGVNPAKYISETAAPTLNSTTTQDQASRLRALQSLAGLPGTEFDSTLGTYDPNKYFDFNKEGLSGALHNAKDDFEAKRSAIYQKLQNAQSADSYNMQAALLNDLAKQYGMPTFDYSKSNPFSATSLPAGLVTSPANTPAGTGTPIEGGNVTFPDLGKTPGSPQLTPTQVAFTPPVPKGNYTPPGGGGGVGYNSVPTTPLTYKQQLELGGAKFL